MGATSDRQSTKGFTIIEVVIVLALAAFIFTIVFFAVPQLQRALRNSQRERDVSRVAAAVLEFKAVHDGRLPVGLPVAQRNEDRSWLEGHLGGNEFKDVSGNRYAIIVSTWWNSNHAYYSSTGRDIIFVGTNAECDSSRSRGSYSTDPGTSVYVKLYTEGSETSVTGSTMRADNFICKTVTL